MRVDPRFNVEVTHVNNLPVQAPPSPPEATPGPRMRGDVSQLTRGVRTTLPWSKTKLTRHLDPSLEPDNLDLSESWRKTRRQRLSDPDSRLVSDTSDQLEAFLQDLEARGLTAHPQYQQLAKLRDSLSRIADRDARRQGSRQDTPPQLGETFDDMWDKLLTLALGPNATKQRQQERYLKALQLSKAGQSPEAIRLLKRVVSSDPDHLDAHAKLGRLLLEAERYPEAEQHLQHAASFRPRDYALQLGLGELYYHLGESELSRQSFFQASMLGAKHSDPHAWLGVLSYEETKLGQAAASLEKAVQLDPANAVARFYLAQVAFQLNDPLRGNFQLQMVKRLQPLADLDRFKHQERALTSGAPRTSDLEPHRWQPPAVQ